MTPPRNNHTGHLFDEKVETSQFALRDETYPHPFRSIHHKRGRFRRIWGLETPQTGTYSRK
jgi:hypothetical protein